MRYSCPLPASLAAALLLAALPFPDAAEAGPTSQEEVLQARLLTGWQQADGSRMAALQLDLAPGWKTYWRAPGEAGIPPQFDWSGSENLKAVQLHWPAPVIFDTNGMQTIGYREQLILPLELIPGDPSKPVEVVAAVTLGICKDICMPASLRLTTALEGAGAGDPQIRKALKARPRAASAAGLSAVSCKTEAIRDGLRLSADLTLPRQGKAETVAFETADRRIWVSEAESSRKGGALSASADLVGPSAEPFVLDRSGITITVISENGAVEVKGCKAG